MFVSVVGLVLSAFRLLLFVFGAVGVVFGFGVVWVLF